jgi:hypothetical protein
MATTYVKIASVTVGSGGAASIQFTSIPGTYDDLVIKISSRSTTNLGGVWTGVNVRLNGSTTSLTSRQLYGTGSAAGSAATATDNFWTTSSAATASTFDNSEIYIPNYAGSTNKSFSADSVTENNATAALAALTANLWSNTNAVTSITLVEAGNSFAQHSTAVLYGIKRT